MSDAWSRRTLLRASLLSASAAGAGLLWDSAASASAVETTGGPNLPEVPEMHGDRLNNEFWYQYDEAFLYHPSPRVLEALTAVHTALGSVQAAFATAWQKHRAEGTFPDGYVAEFQPIREPIAVIAGAQLDLMHQFYRHSPARLISAFTDFGQGLLYDPRRVPGQRVHMMDYPPGDNPPGAYHVWHAVIRAQTLLGISPARWNYVDRLVGLAWALQSTAKPATDAPDNPPLPERTVARLTAWWLQRSPDEMDSLFDNFPYPPGIS